MAVWVVACVYHQLRTKRLDVESGGEGGVNRQLRLHYIHRVRLLDSTDQSCAAQRDNHVGGVRPGSWLVCGSVVGVCQQGSRAAHGSEARPRGSVPRRRDRRSPICRARTSRDRQKDRKHQSGSRDLNLSPGHVPGGFHIPLGKKEGFPAADRRREFLGGMSTSGKLVGDWVARSPATPVRACPLR